MMRHILRTAVLLLCCLPGSLRAAILTVGSGETYSTIEAAYAAASPGDIIRVLPRAGGLPYNQPALYINKANISFIGQDPDGGRIPLDGTGFNYSGAGSTPRAIFQFNLGADNGRVENFEIRYCTNSSYNGAAVRINEANNVAVRNCDVHHNDMGFMSNGSAAGGTATNQLIENCVVHHNGNTLQSGFNHNFYMGGHSVTLRGCNVYAPGTAHNVKSRAHLTILEGCFIHDSLNRELDLVDDSANTTLAGSHALVKGCTIVKDPACPGNRTVIHFGQDGGHNHNGTLHIVNSTIVTPFVSPVVDLSAADAGVCFRNTLVVDPTGNQGGQVLVNAQGDASRAHSSGANLWLSYGLSPPVEGDFSAVTIGSHGYVPPFRDTPSGDYRLTSNATAIVDAGRIMADASLPASLQGRPLRTHTPNLGSQLRLIQGEPDIGAFEWNTLTQVNTNRPATPIRLVFVHHSCGNNWLDTGNGNLGNTLGQNNYYVRDTYYGWSATQNPDIGSSTDIGHWYTWFSDGSVQANGITRHDNILNSLFATASKNATYDSTLCADPGGGNEIVMIKSCYPNSHILDDNGTVPSELFGQDCYSGAHTLGNGMAIYREILPAMKIRADKMFVVVTAPPLVSGSTSEEAADNARALNNWLVTDWLREANWENRNVFVFDLFNVLTDANNHHRVSGSAIEHLSTNGNNYSAYGSGGDSHPTAAGNQKATAEFVPLLNVFHNRWMTRRDAVDHDGDRMPDRWEILHAGSTAMTPSEDADGDDMSNIGEWIAGTLPGNATSRLELAMSRSNAAICVRFTATPPEGTGYAGRTRVFGLEQTESLLTPSWSAVAGHTNIIGAGQQVLCPTGPSDAACYRLRARLE